MSIRAGSIVTVAGRNVVDRLQSAGLGDARVPVETIREIGNDLVVDKVPGEPDYTFNMESWDVTTDLMAFLHGKLGNQIANQPPGYSDAAGTEYKWEDVQYVNITSPWKRNTGAAGGNVAGGLIIPGYFPTRLRYRFGVTDNAVQEVELAGGNYYYAAAAPVEEAASGDGTKVAFVTSEAARAHRLGGPAGTTFQYCWGVMVNGVMQVNGVDYNVTKAGAPAAAGVATITFVTPPPAGADVRWAYFTDVAKAVPQSANADATIKPGAVRGRHIEIAYKYSGTWHRIAGVQTVELEATIDGEVEREMGNTEITGRVVNGTDVTGTITIRSKDIQTFFDTLSHSLNEIIVTEVFGYFYQEIIPVRIRILDPRNPANALKTIYIAQGQFQPPGTPARVNQPTDFGFQFNAVNGTFSEYKGEATGI